MATPEQIRKAIDLIREEQEERKLGKVTGGIVYDSDPNFRKENEAAVAAAIKEVPEAVDPTEIDLDKVGDKLRGGNEVASRNSELMKQFEEEAIAAANSGSIQQR